MKTNYGNWISNSMLKTFYGVAAGLFAVSQALAFTLGKETYYYVACILCAFATAAALYYMLEHIDRPVILTGSQRPLGTDGSDAEGNLRLAYEAACSDFVGVCLAFGGRLIHGNAAKKIHSLADDAFRSIGRAEIDLTVPSAPSAPTAT